MELSRSPPFPASGSPSDWAEDETQGLHGVSATLRISVGAWLAGFLNVAQNLSFIPAVFRTSFAVCLDFVLLGTLILRFVSVCLQISCDPAP